MRVASKTGNLLSKFGHYRSLGSRIIRYVRDGRTDRQTDGQKQRLLCPLPYGRGITIGTRLFNLSFFPMYTGTRNLGHGGPYGTVWCDGMPWARHSKECDLRVLDICVAERRERDVTE